MILKINPTEKLKGAFKLPASKSYSIRAFIIAACGGVSQVIDASDCDDAKVAISTAKFLGNKLNKKADTWVIQPSKTKKVKGDLDVNESGTVLRLVLPVLAAQNQHFTVNGKKTLVGRPNHFLNSTLREMGANIKGYGAKESVPITIKPAKLKGGKIKIDGSISSQFISALLITTPKLDEDSFVMIKGRDFVSKDYITMTLAVLKKAGIKISQRGSREFMIKGKQQYKGLKNFKVPSDFGLAAFPMAAAVLCASDVKLTGHLAENYIQADGHIFELLSKMGVKFKKTSKEISIKGPFELRGGDFSLKSSPDLVPIMSVLALFAKGPTRLYDIGHARAKESDRISDLRKELLKIGAKVKETSGELIIEPIAEYKKNCVLDPHHDHRLAMAFAVLGLKIGVRVKDIECCSKSYPGFVKDLKSIGAGFRKMN